MNSLAMEEKRSSTALHWLKSLKPQMAAHDRVPLLVGPASFSWKRLTQLAKEQLKLENLTLKKNIPHFVAEDEVASHLESDHLCFAIQLLEITTPLYLLLSKRELVHLFCHLLDVPDAKDALEEPYLDGFVSFLLAAAFDIIEMAIPDEGWSLRLQGEAKLPPGDYLSLGVEAHVDKAVTLMARVALPGELYREMRDHFVDLELYQNRVSEKVDLTLGLQAGLAKLRFDEWKSLKEGDVVLLVRLTVMRGERKGKGLLTLDGRPLFRAKVKRGAMKIIEPITHEEVSNSMQIDDENEEDIVEEEELEDEDDLEEEDELEEYADEDDNEDDDEDEDEEEEDGPGEPGDDEVEEFTEEQSLVDESAAVEEESAEKEEPFEIKEAGHPPVTPFEKEELDVDLIVEVGRMKISLDKLTKLQPGNVLNLDINPESGVDLVVNNKVVGRAELLLIGDLLGVRVLDLGK